MQKIKDNLSTFRKVFFREKYRFDQGNAFLVFLNFALLVATLVGQKNGSSHYIAIYVIVGLFATWLLGYILDKVVRVQDIQERVSLDRSPIWQRNFSNHEAQEQKLIDLVTRLERLEKQLGKKIDKVDELAESLESSERIE